MSSLTSNATPVLRPRPRLSRCHLISSGVVRACACCMHFHPQPETSVRSYLFFLFLCCRCFAQMFTGWVAARWNKLFILLHAQAPNANWEWSVCGTNKNRFTVIWLHYCVSRRRWRRRPNIWPLIVCLKLFRFNVTVHHKYARKKVKEKANSKKRKGIIINIIIWMDH